jgi:hypothetical protein
MTTPTPAGNQPPPAGNPSGPGLPVRPLTAWALLALAAVVVLFAFLRWIFPPFPQATRFSVGSFANTTVLVMPLLAMLVATRIGPVLRSAKLMGLVALAIYGVAMLFGVVSFLVTIADKFDIGDDDDGAYYTFGAILQGFGDLLAEVILLGLLGLAALWTFKLFTGVGGKLPVVNVQTD